MVKIKKKQQQQQQQQLLTWELGKTAPHQAPPRQHKPCQQEMPQHVTKNANKRQHHSNTALTTTQHAPCR